MVILVTGRAGSGKSHYAREWVREKLNLGKEVMWVDGDIFRQETGNDDFSNKGRKMNLRNAAIRAAEFEGNGALVICSFVAPRKKWRNMMRKYWKESLVVYIPGGVLWEGTSYEIPDMKELMMRRDK
jgi:adenylylsulfate kinase-like enzyme